MITLCAQIVALHAPMVAAFRARLDRLRDLGSALPTVGPDAATEWFADILATLQVPLDDPDIVPRLATLVEHGLARGIDEAGHRAGFEAFVWACRDVLSLDRPPDLASELHARGLIVTRLLARHARSGTLLSSATIGAIPRVTTSPTSPPDA